MIPSFSSGDPLWETPVIPHRNALQRCLLPLNCQELEGATGMGARVKIASALAFPISGRTWSSLSTTIEALLN